MELRSCSYPLHGRLARSLICQSNSIAQTRSDLSKAILIQIDARSDCTLQSTPQLAEPEHSTRAEKGRGGKMGNAASRRVMSSWSQLKHRLSDFHLSIPLRLACLPRQWRLFARLHGVDRLTDPLFSVFFFPLRFPP